MFKPIYQPNTKQIFLLSIGLIWCLAVQGQSHVFHENGREVTSFMLPEQFVNQSTDQIWKDTDGQLWFLKVGQIFRYDGASFEPVSFNHQGINHSLGRQYNQIFRDHNRNIWVSRMGGGIGRYEPESGVLSTLQVDSLNDMGRITNSFVEDQQGNIWVGAEWGILKINNGILDSVTAIQLTSPFASLKPHLDALVQQGNRLAAHLAVPNHSSLSHSFTVEADHQLLYVTGLGEYSLDGRMLDKAWITDENGATVWAINLKNAYIETLSAMSFAELFQLEKGTYQLHYKTNDRYASGDWVSPFSNPTLLSSKNYSSIPVLPEWYGVQVFEGDSKMLMKMDSIWNRFSESKGFYLLNSSLYEDQQGRIWVYGLGGIQQIVSKPSGETTFQSVIGQPGSPTELSNITALCQRDSQTLWVAFQPQCGEDGYLGVLDIPTKTVTRIKTGLDSDYHITSMIQGKDEHLWLGSINEKGLYCLEPPFIPMEENGSPFSTSYHGDRGQFKKIKSLEFDDYGNLWVGTWSDYFHKIRLDPSSMKIFDLERVGLHSITDIATYKDRTGRLWLSLLDGSTDQVTLGEYFPEQDSFIHHGQVFHGIFGKAWRVLDEQSNGNLVCHNGEYIFILPPGEDGLTAFPATNLGEIPIKNIPGTFLLNDSMLVVARRGKVFHIYQDKSICQFQDYLDKLEANIGTYGYSVYAEPQGEDTLWVRMMMGHTGQFTWNGSDFDTLLIHPVFQDMADLIVASNGEIWSTAPHLSTNLTSAGYQTTISNSIIDQAVKYGDGTMYETSDGDIWYVGKRGAFSYDPISGETRVLSHLTPLIKNIYTGMNRHDDHSVTIACKKEMDAGIISHFYHFHPDSFVRDKLTPNMVLREITVQSGDSTYNLDLSWFSLQDMYEFPHDQNSLTIRYRGVQFNYPEGVRYQYRLEGSSNESWIDAGKKREASFFDLAPGGYTFSVKARNADGYWSEPVNLNLTILQPWWWSVIARLFYLIFLIAAAYGFYRFQLSRQLARGEARRLSELDAVKTRLYTNITHEFRTPLTVIQGMAEKVAEKPERFLDSGIRMIRRNSQHLLRLVNQLLDLAKLESGFLKLQQQAVEIGPFLAYLIESFQSYAETQELDLQYLPAIEDTVIEADQERLTDVVSNLLSNAIKFTPPGGKIYVSSRLSEKQLTLSVKDTGTGIPADALPHIFDRFYQADSSDTRSGEGTGVGLALTRELVQLMGGEIRVESEEGQGSTFTVSLPVKVLDAEPAAGEAAIVSVLSPEFSTPLEEVLAGEEVPNILIVEDNADVATYLQSCLEGSYRVSWARDGEEGIEQAGKLIPDLVISDVMMPKKDGYELCYEVKHNVQTSHIPVILLTARADMDSRLDGLRRGADAYLVKPFDETELSIRIETLLTLRRNLQSRYLTEEETTESLPEGFEQEDEFIAQFRQVVMGRLSDPTLDVTALTEALLMSRTPLHNKVKALTGKSTTEFVRFIRLRHAQELLRDPQYNVSEVAYATGFQSLNYFSKRFRELTGVSPSVWRDGD